MGQSILTDVPPGSSANPGRIAQAICDQMVVHNICSCYAAVNDKPSSDRRVLESELEGTGQYTRLRDGH